MDSTTWNPADGVYVSERAHKDKSWTGLHIVSFAACVAGGAYGWKHMNPIWGDVAQPDFMNNPDNCPLDTHGQMLQGASDASDFDFHEFYVTAWKWLAVTTALSVAMGLLFLYLFRNAARTMVRASCMMQVVALVGIAYVAPNGAPTITALVMAGLLALMFWSVWSWLEMVGQLLTVAAHGLSANPALIPLSLALNVALVIFATPLIIAAGISTSNGQLVSNPDVARFGHKGCLDEDDNPIFCCAWQLDSWVPFFLAATIFAIMWTMAIFFQIRTYTVAGSTVQWYFNVNGDGSTRGTSLRSLRQAVTTSFGSICLSSAVLTVVNIIRSALDSVRRRRNTNLLMACLVGLLDCFYIIIQQITHFATIQMAASGQPFFEASRTVTDLLSRNLLSTISVWWMPNMVLTSCSLMLSLLWGALVFASSYAWWDSKHHPQALPDAALLAGISAAVCWAVLSYFCMVLLNVVDAVFICFAHDRDNNIVSRQEVHSVYKELPCNVSDTVVVQPDDEIVYGAHESVHDHLLESRTNRPSPAP